MSEKSGKARSALSEHLKNNPGDSTSGLAWRLLGGGFLNGKAVGTVTITPPQFLSALDIRKRVSEMKNLGQLTTRSRPVCTIDGSTGDGYWPTGSSVSYVNRAGKSVDAGKSDGAKKPLVSAGAIGSTADELID